MNAKSIVGALLIALFLFRDIELITNKKRGERNNNPGNIRFSSANNWQGQVGKDDKNFAIFDTHINGIRALAKMLRNQISSGYNTLEKLISHYAPKSENDTEKYIQTIARLTLIDRKIDLRGISFNTLFRLVKAIIYAENGRVIYSDADISKAIEESYT